MIRVGFFEGLAGFGFVRRQQAEVAALFGDDAEFHGPAEFGDGRPKAGFQNRQAGLGLFLFFAPSQSFGFDGLQGFFGGGLQIVSSVLRVAALIVPSPF